MRLIIFSLLICIPLQTIFSQPDTDVFVMDLLIEDEVVYISNFQNISSNPGYDNQPFFAEGSVLYAGTENNQTEIIRWDMDSGLNHRVNQPTAGGEYSPQLAPNRIGYTAVRLDTSGLQRLYYYDPEGKSSMIGDLQVAYYAFYQKDFLLASVLSDNRLDLVITDLKTMKHDTLLLGSGRSIHRIPQSRAMSYTAVNEEGNHDIFQLDMSSRESFFICQLPIGIQDYAWLDPTHIIIGSNSKLFVYDLFGDGEWKEFSDLSSYKIKNITRVAVSLDGTKLAVAAESDYRQPGDIVSAHIEPFNNRDLDGFANAFSEDVIVGNFPADTLYQGQDRLRKDYQAYYDRVPSSSVEVVKRIVIGNRVIDEEKAVVNGEIYRQVTFYNTSNDRISEMIFLQEKKSQEKAEAVVQKQLDAYNSHDIDAFLATYSEEIKLYNWPEQLRSMGQASMRLGYGQFFDSTPDLNCEIKNRIVIGNRVIDEEYITMNGQNFSAVAVYEVNDGLISKVTFIR